MSGDSSGGVSDGTRSAGTLVRGAAPRSGSAPASAVSARRALIAAVVLVLAFKLWLSAVFPFTGDEAYFATWGAFPDYGYYDHPPMIGWWLYLLLALSHQEWVLRLPVTLLPALVSAGIYLALRSADEERAALAALAFLLVPINVWNIFITTDTPLILFSLLSGLCYRRALASRTPLGYALAGVFLGLAFLSKYFAVLLALAYFAHQLASPRAERDWRGLALTFICALPFGLFNAWWNYEHCWANVLFNVFNRHGGNGWSWRTPLLYAATLAYTLCPVALWHLWRARKRLRAQLAVPQLRLDAIIVVLPLAVFGALSLVHLIGLHWVLSFTPFFFLAAAAVLDARELRRSVVYLAAFSALHAVLIVAASFAPLTLWKPLRYYDGIVYNFRIREVLAALEPYQKDFVLAADGYSPAVIAWFYSGRYFPVFGTASSHGRQDDIDTDFLAFDGKNILVLRKNPPDDAEYRPYFGSVEYRHFDLEGVRFYIVLGRGFDFAAYREGVLAPLRDRYYAVPAWLPQGHCYFCERYFGSARCPVGMPGAAR